MFIYSSPIGVNLRYDQMALLLRVLCLSLNCHPLSSSTYFQFNLMVTLRPQIKLYTDTYLETSKAFILFTSSASLVSLFILSCMFFNDCCHETPVLPSTASAAEIFDWRAPCRPSKVRTRSCNLRTSEDCAEGMNGSEVGTRGLLTGLFVFFRSFSSK